MSQLNKPILKVENLSKQYRLGFIGTGSLSHDFNRWWAKVRGKEDPYLKIGETNDRTTKGKGNYIWALKDINFEIRQGEVMAIVGKNGSGKSTLLKILSKVTGPTTGSIKTKGQISSLLEVGTGFHPELTGRENIFLSGTILGMKRQEINHKLDEIIAFAEVERYIDTPVKRYSSGMYVRLAFAVAAHLQSDIMIVDEVLAVGDAGFRKKCLAKMKQMTNDGRTVLFVSHNMAALQNLCHRGLLLENGCQIMDDDMDVIAKAYMQNDSMKEEVLHLKTKKEGVSISSFRLELEKLSINQPIHFLLDIKQNCGPFTLEIAIGINTPNGNRLMLVEHLEIRIKKISTSIRITLKNNYLPPGNYSVSLYLSSNAASIFYSANALTLEIPDLGDLKNKKWRGLIFPSILTID